MRPSTPPPADDDVVLSPCDLSHPSPGRSGQPGAVVRVGGRVRLVSDRTIVLCDAFAETSVELASLPLSGPARSTPNVGDWVLALGRRSGGGLRDATVLACYPPTTPPSDPGEHQRFSVDAVGLTMAARGLALRAIREYFHNAHFVEVQTPIAVPSPGLDVHLAAFELARSATERAPTRYLITSPEYQMKRLLVGGVPRLFQLVPCFRDGERGPQHNSEFLMLEWYRAFAGMDTLMDDTERVVRAVATALCRAEQIERTGPNRGTIDLRNRFDRLSVGDAFERYADTPFEEMLRLSEEDEDEYFLRLVDRVEPALASYERPVFLYGFPASQASLARLDPRDPRVCERFELYIGGVELCNGFGELTDPVEQRKRLERDQQVRRDRGLPIYPIDERFIGALEEGMPPAAGNALGVERLVMLCLGLNRIDSVVAFPDAWL